MGRNCSFLGKNAKFLVPYTNECEYQVDFRTKVEDKPLGVATVYHPTQVKNHDKTLKIEKLGNKL